MPSPKLAVWAWLALMVAGPFIATRLAAKRLTREQRALLAAAVLLVGAVGFARTVVDVYRRPGQMSVIEAQAMDMGVMKPPVGLTPVAVETVAESRLQAAVTYSGSVVPYAQQDVYPRVTGTLVDLPIYPGDTVRAGQVIARLDTRELDSKRQEAIAAHLAASEAAGAARAEARAAASTVSQATAEQSMAQARLRQAQADLSSSEAAIRASEAQRAAAEARVTRAQREVDAAQAVGRGRAAGEDESQALIASAEAEVRAAEGAVDEARADVAVAERAAAEAAALAQAASAANERAVAAAQALDEEVRQARAEVAARTADQAYAARQLTRYADLLEERAISAAEYDQQRADHDRAQASLALAQAAVDTAEARRNAEQAAARGAHAEANAASERQAQAREQVRAAGAKLARVQAAQQASQAVVTQRRAAVQGRAAERDEAGSVVAQRQADVLAATADLQAAAAAVEQAGVGRTAAQQAVAAARADVDRAKAAVGQRQAEASGADRRASEASRRADQARAGAFTAGTVAGYTEVRATVSGVVTERITSPGTLVQPGMLIARIAQVDRVRLQANVAQADATEIRPMQPVEVRSPRDPARHDETMVSSVFPTSDPASRTQIVEAVIDNADGYYRPGDLVRLRLGTGDSSAAPSITVPLRAVTQIVRGGGAVIGETEPAVWVVRADPDAQAAEDTDWTCTMHPEVSEPGPGTCPKCKMALVPRTVAGGDQSGAAFRVPVVLGANDGDRVIVRSGLRAGDRVITSGLDVLREGDRVRIVQIDGHGPGEATPAADHDHGADHAPTTDEEANYVCPMHPEVTSAEPSSCPKCGMDLVPVER